MVSISKCADPMACVSSPEESCRRIPRLIPVGRRSLVEDMFYRESPGTELSTTQNVVIVMDALKEFSREPLKWALTHLIKSGYNVTLLGVMPWLNLALSVKTWLDIWTLNLEDLKALKEKSELKNNVKYQRLRGIIDLCDNYGVVPQIKVAMGYPLKLVVLEQTTSLHATWVVFDRHHRKNRAFYTKRMPSNIVMMNNEGDVEMLKVRPMIASDETMTPGESPAMIPLVPRVIISDELKKMFKANEKDK